MAERLVPKGAFDIPDVPSYVPRRLKPWLFVLFVIVIQFSGGVYLAAASYMVGDKALMQQDILMAGYASLVGMSLNFAVMFRIKFRYSTRIQLLASCAVLIAANAVCALSESVPLIVASCFVAGWFRMQATFACNSTIQLWITPYRDMSIFFCYVYVIVDGVIQLCGIATVYAAFNFEWQYMQWIIIGSLAVMMVLVMVLVRPVRCPMYIPLLGIDWIGGALWGIFMLCFTYICVYGDYYDWWDADEMRFAALLGSAALGLNLWRASFLHHPYISFAALQNRNLVRAVVVYMLFFGLLATEHVFEHTYAASILGFDNTNLIDLNVYVFAGIVAGVAFTYFTFALHKWRYKTMTVIGFALAAGYLAWFYFGIDYGVEKQALFVPLFMRGMASVIISIVFLTSILQGGLPFMVFPQALTVNGFAGAVAGNVFGSALLGEALSGVVAKNTSLLGMNIMHVSVEASHMSLPELNAMVMRQSLMVSMKEIFGWLLLVSLVCVFMLMLSYAPVRPSVIFPKWKTIRRTLRKTLRAYGNEE